MTSIASAAASRSRTDAAAPKPAIPRYSGCSFEMTSPRRHAAMTGTWSSSAKRSSSVEVRARRMPPPARMTGRSAEASSSITARRSSSAGRAGPGRPASTRASVGRGLIEQVLRERQEDGAWPPTEGLADGLGQDRGDVLRLAGLGGPLREAADRRDLVDLLERLVATMRSLDLADDREHRGRVLAGRVDADREVRGADAPGAEAGRRVDR